MLSSSNTPPYTDMIAFKTLMTIAPEVNYRRVSAFTRSSHAVQRLLPESQAPNATRCC
ncbi:hypothetical protein EJ04DRAFT_511019 [Polyplosphaeria fusca]|uniref:Uncharacterized protein n=1 Tax=Polyplosphaeria fusca TaxID=682080 RepID=A0A9P4R3V4_9PLEO|nr:hypothetical protein EJ04DRAFT_511019 [Polyplosphaeria fusca]